jgi:hypothetical protein
MRSSRARLLAAALAPVAIGMSMVFGSAVPANASDSACSRSGECIYITGPGRHVDSIKGTYHDSSYSSLNVHIEITNPNHNVAKNCPQVYILLGDTISCTWSPNKDVAIGSYCVTAWDEVAPGYYDNLGSACAPVSG